MDFYFGKVVKVLDPDTHKIQFDVPNFIVGGEASSIFQQELVEEGDEVMIFHANSLVNSTFLYKRVSHDKSFRIYTNDAQIRVQGGMIYFDAPGTEPDNLNYLAKYEPIKDILETLIDVLCSATTTKGDRTIDPASNVKLQIAKDKIRSIQSLIAKTI